MRDSSIGKNDILDVAAIFRLIEIIIDRKRCTIQQNAKGGTIHLRVVQSDFRSKRINENRIVPLVVPDEIAAALRPPYIGVVTGGTMEMICSFSPIERIVAFIANEEVGARVTIQDIVTFEASQEIVARAAAECVVPNTTFKGVVGIRSHKVKV